MELVEELSKYRLDDLIGFFRKISIWFKQRNFGKIFDLILKASELIK